MRKIQLAIVDDDQLMVELLTDFFFKYSDFNITLTSNSGNDFLSQLNLCKTLPTIVLLDLRMEDGDGIKVTEHLTAHFPTIKIIMLSSHAKKTFTGYLLKLGVNAFLPKRIPKQQLLDVIQEVNDKGFYFSEEQVEVLRNQIQPQSPKPIFRAKEKLSEKELEVLELICQQYTAKEIAERLFVSVKAIESRKGTLLMKLGVKNTAGLIVYAIQNKLVDPDSIILLE